MLDGNSWHFLLHSHFSPGGKSVGGGDSLNHSTFAVVAFLTQVVVLF